MTKRFVLVAGEASGDALGGALIEALRGHFPGAAFSGVGGDRMASVGCDLWDRYDAMAVMGFAEVLSRLPALLRLRRGVLRETVRLQPACYVGIDAPDFNLGIERQLKSRGITTCHYASPSVWAWRRKRAAKIAASTDLILTLFPFEPEIYDDFGGNARFVGHPLADDIPLEVDREAARRSLNEPSEGQVLAVLPGSRTGELARLGEPFVAAASRLKERLPPLRFVTPLARPAMRAPLSALISRAGLSHCWRLVDGQAQQAVIASDAVLLASGTAALETMLCQRPMVVSYRISPLTYAIVTHLGMLNSDVFSLPNVLTDEPVVPELLQSEATPERLADAVFPLLTDPTAANRQVRQFEAAHRTLRQGGAARAADEIAALIQPAA